MATLARPAAAGLALLVAGLAAATATTACSRSDPSTPAAAAKAGGTEARIGFDDLPAGAAPAGFHCAWPGPAGIKPARWEVVEASDARSGGKVLQQSDADDTNHRFPVALYEGLRLADARVTVQARAVQGGMRDRSFGVVIRAQDERNYYCARANTSGWGENVRLYRFVDGQRTELGEWEGPVAPDAWHELALEAVGDRLRVMLDGRLVIERRDTAFAGAGLAGVWTKAESVSRFDDLAIQAVAP